MNKKIISILGLLMLIGMVVTISGCTSDSGNSTQVKGTQVKVTYDGSWSGAYGDENSLKSVDGKGTKTFNITGDPFVVSANFQKKDGSSKELVVEILKDGEVVETSSTSAAYGVASVTH